MSDIQPEFEQKSRIPAAAGGPSRRASYVSLGVSLSVLVLKFWGYRITGSQAVFSDAMESIVNVVAAAIALVVLAISLKPADKGHPYGHGKAEFFSAAFEGGLIAFASVLICFEAVQALWHGTNLTQPGVGIVITAVGGGINALLGIFLIRIGRRHGSAALQASGQHVLSDFVTSAGVVLGLSLVLLTGQKWIDPLAALIVGLLLARTGFKLVRRSVGGLMDEEDRDILQNLIDLIGRDRPPGIIQLHHTRVMRSGHYHHIDAHAVVPEFWNVAEAHDQIKEFEEKLMCDYPYAGELHLHVDPCRRAYCRACSVANCPIRRHPFERQRQLTIDEITNPDEPKLFVGQTNGRP